jgi:hypothetical protein
MVEGNKVEVTVTPLTMSFAPFFWQGGRRMPRFVLRHGAPRE